MKALSLWQPWATMMAEGLKKIETRHWATKYRGPLLIHAAQHLETPTIFESALLASRGAHWTRLPRGFLLCKVEIVDCQRITEDNIPLDEQERRLGDYTPGRFMWITTSLEAFRTPLPYRGRQGLFEVPDHIVKLATMRS
jgi:hypothetical protein